MRRCVALALACAGSAAAADEPAPNIHGETIPQVAKRTGYTVEEIRKYFPPIEKWPARLGVGKIAESFARGRFRPPPKPYVHPRIYFNAEDLPEIRRRLKQTHVGRVSKLETFSQTRRNRRTEHKRVVLPLRGLTGTYKVMLLPLRKGEQPPKTARSKDQTKLTVEWRGQKDEYTFRLGGDGRTRVRMTRGGKTALSVE